MAKLYLITDASLSAEANLELFTEEIIEGCGLFQLRLGEDDDRLVYETALEFSRRCHARNVPFVVNDRVDIALASGADGVHLGETDLPITVVRRLVGDQLLIGRTVRNCEQALTAQNEGASYLAVGPCFKTSTKPKLKPVGIGTLQEVISCCELPVCAIGGITIDNLAQILDAQPAYTSIISAVSRSGKPLVTKRKLLTMLSIDEHNLSSHQDDWR